MRAGRPPEQRDTSTERANGTDESCQIGERK